MFINHRIRITASACGLVALLVGSPPLALSGSFDAQVDYPKLSIPSFKGIQGFDEFREHAIRKYEETPDSIRSTPYHGFYDGVVIFDKDIDGEKVQIAVGKRDLIILDNYILHMYTSKQENFRPLPSFHKHERFANIGFKENLNGNYDVVEIKYVDNSKIEFAYFRGDISYYLHHWKVMKGGDNCIPIVEFFNYENVCTDGFALDTGKKNIPPTLLGVYIGLHDEILRLMEDSFIRGNDKFRSVLEKVIKEMVKEGILKIK